MYPADHDLSLAAAAIDRMTEATQLPVLVAAWEDFLFRIERAWEKCEQEAKAAMQGGSWLASMHRLRKKDALLRYLRQARNAETHAISATLDAPIRLSVTDKYGRPFQADAVLVSIEGQTLVFDIQSTDIGIEWTGRVEPTDPRLVRFKNRGEWYNPPHSHLRNPLPELHPVAVAVLGLHFYRGAREALKQGHAPPGAAR